MAAGKYDLVVDQGADFALALTLTKAGSAINLDGYTARAHIRATKESSNYTPFAFNFTNRSEGKVTMSLSSTASSNMSAGQYLYDLEIVASTDAVTRILEGKVTLIREITR